MVRKALLLACAALTPSLVAVPAAHADPTYHYTGGCGLGVASDGTDSMHTDWDGFVWAMATATDAATGLPATVSITVECHLLINGVTPGTIVSSASGTGTALNVGQLSFNADPDDVVSMCDHVTVGNELHVDCSTASAGPVVPEPVWYLADLFTESTCDDIGALHGGPLDQPPAWDIRPDGNIYAIRDSVHVWQCPTIDDSGRQYYTMIDAAPPLPYRSS